MRAAWTEERTHRKVDSWTEENCLLIIMIIIWSECMKSLTAGGKSQISQAYINKTSFDLI